MEKVHTVTVYQSKRLNMPQDLDLYEHGAKNFKISYSLRSINPLFSFNRKNVKYSYSTDLHPYSSQSLKDTV